MKFWVGVTDGEWFDYLARQPFDEVNFWQPNGAVAYTGLEPGSLFLFKLKRPNNHIAGGGYFVRSSAFPASLVWEAFGSKNGAQDFAAFMAMIRRHAREGAGPDPQVGCTVLSSPFFWPREKWIADPAGWSGSIVRGRYYDTDQADGSRLWSEVQVRMADPSEVRDQDARYGTPRIVNPRLGQGGFRVVVTDAYSRRCAITGESTLPVLDAAHIQPFSEQGPHSVNNGLLLRTDFHKLFDLGLVTVTPELRIEVSNRIREEWFNGKAYYRLHGQRLASIPAASESRPSEALLQWHNENRFRA